jgi:hypothetical protein
VIFKIILRRTKKREEDGREWRRGGERGRKRGIGEREEKGEISQVLFMLLESFSV